VLIALCFTDVSARGATVSSPTSIAVRLIQKANRGDPNAQAQLGWLYSIGSGVPQNYYLAAKWYHRAAARGHGGAQFALGLLYDKGLGVPHDLVLAYMWLNLSASQAVGTGRDFKVRIRDSVASKMTPTQVDIAQRMARARYFSR
jgi:TPR repeat protein